MKKLFIKLLFFTAIFANLNTFAACWWCGPSSVAEAQVQPETEPKAFVHFDNETVEAETFLRTEAMKRLGWEEARVVDLLWGFDRPQTPQDWFPVLFNRVFSSGYSILYDFTNAPISAAFMRGRLEVGYVHNPAIWYKQRIYNVALRRSGDDSNLFTVEISPWTKVSAFSRKAVLIHLTTSRGDEFREREKMQMLQFLQKEGFDDVAVELIHPLDPDFKIDDPLAFASFASWIWHYEDRLDPTYKQSRASFFFSFDCPAHYAFAAGRPFHHNKLRHIETLERSESGEYLIGISD